MPTECDLISLSFSLQMEALKTHFNRRNTWNFHLKEKNKALYLLSYVLCIQNVCKNVLNTEVLDVHL